MAPENKGETKIKTLKTMILSAGATSGRVQVVTPSRTLLSNVPFRVLP